MKKYLVLLSAYGCIGLVNAQQNKGLLGEQATNSHTSRTIKLNNPAQTNWQFEISPLTEQSLVNFNYNDSSPIPLNTLIPITNDVNYGFSFSAGADFNIVYAVTAISFDSDATLEGNPKCVFLFTGLKPAVPENAVSNFAGAKCQLQRDQMGNLNLVLDKVI